MNELTPHPLQEDDQLDQVFYILSSPRRRHVLEVLYQEGGTVDDLTTLTDHIAARENDKQPHQLTDRERKCVYVSLQQTHVPTLRESDTIRVNTETGSIELTERSYQYDRLLGWSTSRRRFLPYLSLAVGSSLFYLAVIGGVVSHDWITPFRAGLLVFLLFGALAVAEPHLSRRLGRNTP